MSKSDTPTPRTIAAQRWDYEGNGMVVDADTAVELERELQAANARVEELEGYLTFYSTGQKSLEKDLRTQLTEAKAEIERLRFGLAELGALEMSHEGACVRLQNELAEAKAKLESVKKSAKIGMAAAQRIGSVSLAEAQRIQKTLKPETLESEREMNRILTEELEEAKAEIERLKGEYPRGFLDAREMATKALQTRHKYSEPAPCPDGIAGCCVAHYITVERVPFTRDECLEAIRAIEPVEVK